MYGSTDRSKSRQKKLKIDQEKARNMDLTKIYVPINSVTPNNNDASYIFSNKNTVFRNLNGTFHNDDEVMPDTDNEDSHTSKFFLL